MLNSLVGKAEGLDRAPVIARRSDYDSVGCHLVGIGEEMASPGLGPEEQEICPRVLEGLVLAGQEGQFSAHTLAPNNQDWH
jgi:hypothetical protein